MSLDVSLDVFGWQKVKDMCLGKPCNSHETGQGYCQISSDLELRIIIIYEVRAVEGRMNGTKLSLRTGSPVSERVTRCAHEDFNWPWCGEFNGEARAWNYIMGHLKRGMGCWAVRKISRRVRLVHRDRCGLDVFLAFQRCADDVCDAGWLAVVDTAVSFV
jgi:hypothetical protein